MKSGLEIQLRDAFDTFFNTIKTTHEKYFDTSVRLVSFDEWRYLEILMCSDAQADVGSEKWVALSNEDKDAPEKKHFYCEPTTSHVWAINAAGKGRRVRLDLSSGPEKMVILDQSAFIDNVIWDAQTGECCRGVLPVSKMVLDMGGEEQTFSICGVPDEENRLEIWVDNIEKLGQKATHYINDVRHQLEQACQPYKHNKAPVTEMSMLNDVPFLEYIAKHDDDDVCLQQFPFLSWMVFGKVRREIAAYRYTVQKTVKESVSVKRVMMFAVPSAVLLSILLLTVLNLLPHDGALASIGSLVFVPFDAFMSLKQFILQHYFSLWGNAKYAFFSLLVAVNVLYYGVNFCASKSKSKGMLFPTVAKLTYLCFVAVFLLDVLLLGVGAINQNVLASTLGIAMYILPFTVYASFTYLKKKAVTKYVEPLKSLTWLSI
ncbi:hypothetical protein LRP49_07025 [Enterovibrio sp. ZSDZ35]|uniref:Uncharacterized protein n=1 Tax=Enterovibrio qingdaonensis TaxID=2899818 RepID=A0ABT5QIZ0_9GAMM|nr:hypothetical protein [Enterovibrio sp. ZSDZ35]MDD1780953.1 hypothetical protein [Enterovibrio sp. ZSDZ35]